MTDALHMAQRRFRAQPILCARTKAVKGLELLSRSRLDFNDPQGMLMADVEAIKAAWAVANHYRGSMRVHCNVEISSMGSLLWTDTMVEYMCPGVVVELVERNDSLTCSRSFSRICQTVQWVRRMGGVMAMDDWTGKAIEMGMLRELNPEFVKVNEPRYLRELADCGLGLGTQIVVERIESLQQATDAERIGATELQGYWCDVHVEHDFPAEFTPPGVIARDMALTKVA